MATPRNNHLTVCVAGKDMSTWSCVLFIAIGSMGWFVELLRNRGRNIPACSVTILQQTTTIAGLINNIYAAIEHNEEAMKAERFESLGPATFFIDRKYYINRSPNYGNSSKYSLSSPFRNSF